MKTKTKMIISLSIVGAIVVGALITLVAVIASFNSTSNSNLRISYTAQNVEAEVTASFVVSEAGISDPKSLNYTTLKAGLDEVLSFTSSDVTETSSKAFDDIPNIELTRDDCLYLKYTFKHTGTKENSKNYLNVILNNTFTELNNINIEYLLYDPSMSDSYSSDEYKYGWMADINGLTITRDVDNECVLFVRVYVDIKSQDALLDGSIAFSMSASETEYYANLKSFAMTDDKIATSVHFGLKTAENLAIVEGVEPVPLSADGSGPIEKYQLADGTTYILSDTNIYVTNGSHLFAGDTSLSRVEFGGLNTSNVLNMSYMFYCCALTSIDLSPLDTSSVVLMKSMFSGNYHITDLDLSTLNTRNVVDMSYMFYSTNIKTLNFNGWDTSNVTTMRAMFSGCTYLTTLDLSQFNTSKVDGMGSMFEGCTKLTSLDLSKFRSSKLEQTYKMFYDCSSLITIYINDSWTTENVTNSTDMFGNCISLVGGNGTTYNLSYTDATYARIDTAKTPGYFTLKTS